MDTLTAVLAVAVPALLAGAALLLRRGFAGALALALAVLAGLVVLFHDGTLTVDVPPRLGLVAIVAAVAGSLLDRPKLRFALLAVASIAAPAVVLQAVPAETLALKEKLGWGALEALGVFFASGAVDLWAKRHDGPHGAAVLWLLAAGGAAVDAVGGGYVAGGQVAGAVAGGLGALAVMSWLRPTQGVVRAAVPVVSTVLAGLWLDGYYIEQLPPSSAAILLLAPALVWLPEAAKKPRLASVPVLGAVLVAFGLSAPDEVWDKFRKPRADAASVGSGE